MTLVVAGAAWWWSGSLVRAVAVLVTATPCPLLLAVPVAVTAGMSATSRRGVVVRDGAALERLGQVRTAILDKTGTITAGVPRVTEILAEPGRDPVTMLGWAAAIEQGSPHVLATAVVTAAQDAGAPSAEGALRTRRRPDPALRAGGAGLLHPRRRHPAPSVRSRR